jgi:IclR family KDG regulon transcriptional repressor
MNSADTPSPKNGQYEVGVLCKSLDILDLLANCPRGSTVTQMSAALKYSKPTVFRIIKTLEGRGYVQRRDGSRYRLTARLSAAAGHEPLRERLLEAAPGVMQGLVDRHRETVNLGVLDAGEIVVVQAFESPQAIRMSSKVGSRRHFHSTALGKVLVAWQDPAAIERLASNKGLPRLNRRTITGIKELKEHLAKVRKAGIAEDNEENEPGGRCVAVPIWSADGEVVAALSVSGPVTRMSDRSIRAIARDLKLCGQQLSNMLK